MIKEFKKAIGYICPFCSTITAKEVNLFCFSDSSPTEFGCSNSVCSQIAVTIQPKKDKYSITVDCPICGEPHHFNIRKVTFWESEFFVLHCPETGFGILFIGTDERIKAEISQQEQLLSKFDDDEVTIGDELSNIFETVEHINEICKNDGIYCSCGSRNIGIEIDNDKITLTCRDCGKEKYVLTDFESLKKLLDASTIVLD